MTSVNPARGRLQALTAPQVEALASDLPLRLPSHHPLPRRRLGSPPPRRSRRTPADRAVERAPVISRRQRRVHNDLALAQAAVEHGAQPATMVELKALFSTTSHSAWSHLCQDKDAAAVWRAFVEMEEEMQSVLLSEGEGRQKAIVSDALMRVDRRFRELIKERPALLKPWVEEVESKVVCLPPGGTVCLRLPHALGRLVAHGVAQFHALGHRSVGKGEERVTVIHAKANGVAEEGVRLLDVLAC